MTQNIRLRGGGFFFKEVNLSQTEIRSFVAHKQFVDHDFQTFKWFIFRHSSYALCFDEMKLLLMNIHETDSFINDYRYFFLYSMFDVGALQTNISLFKGLVTCF